MAINTTLLKKIFPLLLFIVILIPLEAQESDRNTENRLVQRLAWTGDEYAMRYDVLIERENEETGAYGRALQKYTTESFVEVSLSPGRYRYRVIPHDYLDKPGAVSQWMNFEIRMALIPEIDDFWSDVFFTGEDNELALFISGNNISPDAEIYLRHSENDKGAIYPDLFQVYESGSRVLLYYKTDRISPGTYTVFIRNPGGFEASKDNFVIAPLEPEIIPVVNEPLPLPMPEPKSPAFAFHAGLAWMPVFPIHGGIAELFEKGMNKAGLSAQLGLVYNRSSFLNYGIELSGSLYSLRKETGVNSYNNDYFRADALVFLYDINLVARKWIADTNFAFTVFAGGGNSYQTGSFEESVWIDSIGPPHESSGDLDGKTPHANLGISLLWLLTNHLYLDARVVYTRMFVRDNASGYLRPSIGIGWHSGR